MRTCLQSSLGRASRGSDCRDQGSEPWLSHCVGVIEMDDLIKLICAKTGINAEQAKTAAETTLAFLKERLPGPVAAQVEALVKKGNAAAKLMDVAKGLGGFFGKK